LYARQPVLINYRQRTNAHFIDVSSLRRVSSKKQRATKDFSGTRRAVRVLFASSRDEERGSYTQN
jgi:hypothetical protein